MTVTSREIMKALDVKNVKTLTRWHQAGAIPEPTVDKHPGGIGRMAYWPDWVLRHCAVVKKLTTQGQSLADISATFGDDWDAIATRYQRHYLFADVNEKMDYDNQLAEFRKSLEDALVNWIVAFRQRLLATTLPPISLDLATQAFDLASDGYNPVLVLYENGTAVAPDFMVGDYLSHQFKTASPLLIVPLHSLVASCFAADDIPCNPTVRPARKIVKIDSRKSNEESFDALDDWKFRIPERKPKRK